MGANAKAIEQRGKHLDRLADTLIARHLRLSVPDSAARDRLAEAPDGAAYRDKMIERQMRCIAVVGAGASAPLLKRGRALAKMLEKQFGRNRTELERLELVNNADRRDFETRLVALSSTPEAERQVRKTISEEYRTRYPTMLGYELIAHLLKHRFLDAIISFNFDELLDQSLDDELAPGEYERVVSDRDCAGLQPDADHPSYVPLYIKLHGTASEPDSLRFTPDAYYSIPSGVAALVESLLQVEHGVVVNVGSGLSSFDLQRLLGLPQRLDVFDLSRDPLPETVIEKIDAQRRRRPRRRWLHDCSPGQQLCDVQLQDLTRLLERKARRSGAAPGGKAKRGAGAPIVQFRSVSRHEVVASLLGSGLPANASGPRWTKRARVDYLRRRTILELAFAGAKARGLMSLVPLSRDRPARYYHEYRQLTEGGGDDWAALCSAAGLRESRSVPDNLLSNPTLRKTSSKRSKSRRQRGEETHSLHEFCPEKLARHVLARVKNPASEDELKLLKHTIAKLQEESDIELHAQDDRVCSKAFKRPVTLTTTTSLEAYTRLMLRDLTPRDRIYISSETGAWLTFDRMRKRLKKLQRIRVLLAFDIGRRRLKRAYKRTPMETRVVNPWHHNRHMTIVCNGKQPTRAIYFARHLRAPMVTAVYLESARDVQRLMTMFETRWKEASRDG